MAVGDVLPRVTYSNVREDFSGVHRFLDGYIPGFVAGLGKTHPNIVAGKDDTDGAAYTVRAPFDDTIALGTFYDASRAVEAARAAQGP